MRRMADESLDEQIATIIRTMDERKTRQFTSQNSGMKFKQIESVSGNINFVQSTTYAGEVHLITNYYTPEHGRPALTMPHIEFLPSGYRFEIIHDYERDYMNIIIYNSGGNFLGYMDIWSFYHRRGTTDGTYGWQTVVYTWGSASFLVPFTITLRATDSGTHTVQVESSVL